MEWDGMVLMDATGENGIDTCFVQAATRSQCCHD